MLILWILGCSAVAFLAMCNWMKSMRNRRSR